MNDELQRQLADLVKALLAAAQQAGTFAEQQIPPLVQEKIWYGRVWHPLVAAGCLIATVMTARFLVPWLYRKADDDEFWVFPIVASVAGMIVLSIVVVIQFREAVLAWVAPRLYIVEWLLSLPK